jgi:hypothetical protein
VSIIWAYLQVRAFGWLLRLAGRLLLFAAVAALLVAATPVTPVAAVGLAGAWLRGWPPARLRRAAAWALPMTAIYLAGRAVQARTWQALAFALVHDYLTAWHAVAAGQVVSAFVLATPVAGPAGLAAAAGLSAWRIYALETGLSGKTATAPGYPRWIGPFFTAPQNVVVARTMTNASARCQYGQLPGQPEAAGSAGWCRGRRLLLAEAAEEAAEQAALAGQRRSWRRCHRALRGYRRVVVGPGDGVHDLGLVEVLRTLDKRYVPDEHAIAHDLGL